MQDKYVGDVGDFGKLGLLRYLCGITGDPPPGDKLTLGVIWYRFDEDQTADGRKTDYLTTTNRSSAAYSLRKCDEELFRKLYKIVCDDDRREIRALEEESVLPGAVFFDRTVPRDKDRDEWVKHAHMAMKNPDIVFVDPNNGLEVASADKFSAEGPKFAFYDELIPMWKRGQSLIIYQQTGRLVDGIGATSEEQIAARCDQLREKLSDAEPIALRFRRGTQRVFYVVPNLQAKDPNRKGAALLLKERAEGFAKLDCWKRGSPPHFDRVII